MFNLLQQINWSAEQLAEKNKSKNIMLIIEIGIK